MDKPQQNFRVYQAQNNTWLIREYGAYLSSGTIESHQRWDTRELAQAAADRVNGGDETGVTFAMYSDD